LILLHYYISIIDFLPAGLYNENSAFGDSQGYLKDYDEENPGQECLDIIIGYDRGIGTFGMRR